MANPKLKMATTVHWTYIPFRSLYFMRKKTKNHEKNIEVPDLANRGAFCLRMCELFWNN